MTAKKIHIFLPGQKLPDIYYEKSNNDVDRGIAFKADRIKMNEDVKYRFAVSLLDYGDSFTLLSFEQSYPQKLI